VTRTALSPGAPFFHALAILTICFGVCMIPSHVAGQPDTEQQAIRQRVMYQLQIAANWLDRGEYKKAEVTLGEIRKAYLEVMTEVEKQRLEELTTQTTTALQAREQILTQLKVSDQLAADGDYAGAIAALEKIQASPYLKEFEKQQVASSIAQLKERATSGAALERRQVEILFEKSVKLFELGELAKARIGFEEVIRHEYQPKSADGKAAADYLAVIAEKLQRGAETEKELLAGPSQAPAKTVTYEIPPSRPVGKIEPKAEPAAEAEAKPEPKPEATTPAGPKPEAIVEVKPEPTEPEPKPETQPATEPAAETKSAEEQVEQAAPAEKVSTETTEPGAAEEAVPKPAVEAEGTAEAAPAANAYLNEILRRRKIQRQYTRAHVEEAIRQAEAHLKANAFAEAKLALAAAFRLVNTNRLLLGDEYQTHVATLDQVSQQIDQARAAWEETQAEAQAKATAEKAAQLRDEIERQRQQAVADYYERAVNFRKEERFEEALGQIEQLLAIDPRNDNALLLKDILEDEIRWRKELALIKESNKHEMELLVQTYAQGIPYEKEMNYPSDWLEIAKKRKEAITDGRDPADIAVEKQLEEKVDLSALTEQTTLAEAVDILRTSVDPPLNMVVLWQDLNTNAFINQNTPIGLSGAGLTSVPLKTGLDRVLQAVSSGPGQPPLGYVIENGIISIATEQSLPTRYENRVYDVAELLSPPSTGFGMGMMMGGMGGMGGYGGGMGGGMGGFGGGMGGFGGGMGGFGGGMGGFGGGMGGFGGGGMMGGMGGYGGGMMGGKGGMGGMGGMGGYGGGMMGGMGGGIDQMRARMRAYEIIYIIQETIEPDSWFETGTTGEGRINEFNGTQLIVWQTPEIHEKIREFLDRLKALLGQQVAIEARFLVVDENFLQDIGLDVEITRLYAGDRWAFSNIQFDSFDATRPVGSDISGSLAATATSSPALGFGLSYGNALDDLQVNFIIRATQMHANAKTLTAPKAMVMNGETTLLRVTTYSNYKSDSEYTSETVTTTGVDRTFGYWDHTIDTIADGVTMSVTPVITDDKKYVLLNISTSLNDVSFETDTVTAVDPSVGLVTDTFDLPTMDTQSIATRVLVPDKGTVLLGGLTLTAEKEREAGVPGVSKIPLIGRLFSNRSEVKDKQILLILVKPTIILKDEQEAEAVSALQGG